MTYIACIDKAGMEIAMQVGQRVRAKVPLDIDWCGTIPAGVTGVVVPWPSPDNKPVEVLGLVLLDERIEFMDMWDNHYWVFDPEHTADIGWACWEAI